jgi:hypothetical protein
MRGVKLNSLRKGSVTIGFNTVFSAVRAVFLVILESKAAEGASFSSHIILGFRWR